MVLEEGEGSLEEVAVEFCEREKEGINEVVTWTCSYAENGHNQIPLCRVLTFVSFAFSSAFSRRFNTSRFLRFLQHGDGSFDSIKVAYYVASALEV
jgi:hypothetical protein